MFRRKRFIKISGKKYRIKPYHKLTLYNKLETKSYQIAELNAVVVEPLNSSVVISWKDGKVVYKFFEYISFSSYDQVKVLSVKGYRKQIK